ncbi:hypothetical protein BCR44DRAFT_1507647 [Catenaria anguillulae PL171]|uniref:Uncharacterized protein n=1 Tax=Catenaria anguillulae PL171 TaxID=765915 RepID=A0A1Y2H3M9_9FUNG|nr:hypothetical protein BCR44DRAFT_1507647 [Catenaria anguillulae PL171]
MGRYGTIEPNHHFLHSLAISQQKGDHPVLLLTPAAFSKTDEQLATKFWFEECNVPGLALCPAAVAALLGANVTTGIVVDVGDCTRLGVHSPTHRPILVP